MADDVRVVEGFLKNRLRGGEESVKELLDRWLHLLDAKSPSASLLLNKRSLLFEWLDAYAFLKVGSLSDSADFENAVSTVERIEHTQGFVLRLLSSYGNARASFGESGTFIFDPNWLLKYLSDRSVTIFHSNVYAYAECWLVVSVHLISVDAKESTLIAHKLRSVLGDCNDVLAAAMTTTLFAPLRRLSETSRRSHSAMLIASVVEGCLATDILSSSSLSVFKNVLEMALCSPTWWETDVLTLMRKGALRIIQSVPLGKDFDTLMGSMQSSLELTGAFSTWNDSTASFVENVLLSLSFRSMVAMSRRQCIDQLTSTMELIISNVQSSLNTSFMIEFLWLVGLIAVWNTGSSMTRRVLSMIKRSLRWLSCEPHVQYTLICLRFAIDAVSVSNSEYNGDIRDIHIMIDSLLTSMREATVKNGSTGVLGFNESLNTEPFATVVRSLMREMFEISLAETMESTVTIFDTCTVKLLSVSKMSSALHRKPPSELRDYRLLSYALLPLVQMRGRAVFEYVEASSTGILYEKCWQFCENLCSADDSQSFHICLWLIREMETRIKCTSAMEDASQIASIHQLWQTIVRISGRSRSDQAQNTVVTIAAKALEPVVPNLALKGYVEMYVLGGSPQNVLQRIQGLTGTLLTGISKLLTSKQMNVGKMRTLAEVCRCLLELSSRTRDGTLEKIFHHVPRTLELLILISRQPAAAEEDMMLQLYNSALSDLLKVVVVCLERREKELEASVRKLWNNLERVIPRSLALSSDDGNEDGPGDDGATEDTPVSAEYDECYRCVQMLSTRETYLVTNCLQVTGPQKGVEDDNPTLVLGEDMAAPLGIIFGASRSIDGQSTGPVSHLLLLAEASRALCRTNFEALYVQFSKHLTYGSMKDLLERAAHLAKWIDSQVKSDSVAPLYDAVKDCHSAFCVFLSRWLEQYLLDHAHIYRGGGRLTQQVQAFTLPSDAMKKFNDVQRIALSEPQDRRKAGRRWLCEAGWFRVPQLSMRPGKRYKIELRTQVWKTFLGIMSGLEIDYFSSGVAEIFTTISTVLKFYEEVSRIWIQGEMAAEELANGSVVSFGSCSLRMIDHVKQLYVERVKPETIHVGVHLTLLCTAIARTVAVYDRASVLNVAEAAQTALRDCKAASLCLDNEFVQLVQDLCIPIIQSCSDPGPSVSTELVKSAMRDLDTGPTDSGAVVRLAICSAGLLQSTSMLSDVHRSLLVEARQRLQSFGERRRLHTGTDTSSWAELTSVELGTCMLKVPELQSIIEVECRSYLESVKASLSDSGARPTLSMSWMSQNWMVARCLQVGKADRGTIAEIMHSLERESVMLLTGDISSVPTQSLFNMIRVFHLINVLIVDASFHVDEQYITGHTQRIVAHSLPRLQELKKGSDIGDSLSLVVSAAVMLLCGASIQRAAGFGSTDLRPVGQAMVSLYSAATLRKWIEMTMVSIELVAGRSTGTRPKRGGGFDSSTLTTHALLAYCSMISSLVEVPGSTTGDDPGSRQKLETSAVFDINTLPKEHFIRNMFQDLKSSFSQTAGSEGKYFGRTLCHIMTSVVHLLPPLEWASYLLRYIIELQSKDVELASDRRVLDFFLCLLMHGVGGRSLGRQYASLFHDQIGHAPNDSKSADSARVSTRVPMPVVVQAAMRQTFDSVFSDLVNFCALGHFSALEYLHLCKNPRIVSSERFHEIAAVALIPWLCNNGAVICDGDVDAERVAIGILSAIQQRLLLRNGEGYLHADCAGLQVLIDGILSSASVFADNGRWELLRALGRVLCIWVERDPDAFLSFGMRIGDIERLTSSRLDDIDVEDFMHRMVWSTFACSAYGDEQESMSSTAKQRISQQTLLLIRCGFMLVLRAGGNPALSRVCCRCTEAVLTLISASLSSTVGTNVVDILSVVESVVADTGIAHHRLDGDSGMKVVSLMLSHAISGMHSASNCVRTADACLGTLISAISMDAQIAAFLCALEPMWAHRTIHNRDPRTSLYRDDVREYLSVRARSDVVADSQVEVGRLRHRVLECLERLSKPAQSHDWSASFRLVAGKGMGHGC